MSQSNNQVQNKPKFSLAIQTDAYKKLINNTLGDPERAKRFIASVSSAVAINPALQECDAGSILSGALLGETLKLSPSPQLGQYYLVPFNVKIGTDKNGKSIYGKQAQFQLGYKGYIQLAIRSGKYRDLDVIEIRKGEYLGRDKLTGKHQFNFIENETVRENTPIIGYLAYLELVDSLRKTIYWSKEKMQNHAIEYSQAYASDLKKNTNYSFWSKNFDDMAFKTMLRQLISKWGPMSIEFQDVYVKDMSVVKEDGTYDYIDNKTIEETPNKEVINHVEQPVKIEEDKPKEEVKKVSLDDL